MTEQVQPYDPNITQEISRHLGTAYFVQGHKSGGATRDRYYFVFPEPLFKPIRTHALTTNLDGVEWPAMAKPPRAPPTLRAIYPELLRHRLNKQLTPWEHDHLKAFRVFEHHTNSTICKT